MKAILVIDMPHDCIYCPCWRGKNDEFPFDDCTAMQRPLTVEERDNKPDWCPLKQVDAIPISFLQDKIALSESWGCYGYAKGLQSAIDEWEWEKRNGNSSRWWNDCLKEITK